VAPIGDAGDGHGPDVAVGVTRTALGGAAYLVHEGRDT